MNAFTPVQHPTCRRTKTKPPVGVFKVDIMRHRILRSVVDYLAQTLGWWRWRWERSRLGRQAVLVHRLAYWKARLGAFGEDSHVYPTVVISSPEKVRLGKRVNLTDFIHMWAGGGIDIGDDTIIAPHTIITSQTHDLDAVVFRQTNVMAPVRIGCNCWIGAGCIILPGVTIGDGSMIAAGAIVSRDVPARSLVMGAPGRVVRTLDNNRTAMSEVSAGMDHRMHPQHRVESGCKDAKTTIGSATRETQAYDQSLGL